MTQRTNAPPNVSLYSAIGDRLDRYHVALDTGALEFGESYKVAARVQYVWPHPSRQFIYVTTSNGGPRVNADFNHVSAFKVGHDGRLSVHGPMRPLPKRAVHLCVDPLGRFVLNAHNFGGGSMTMHPINPDGSLSDPMPFPQQINCGIYPHQVIMFPSGSHGLIVDRGNKAQGGRLEDPGALRSFRVDGTSIMPGQVIAPNDGYGFGPRHAAFHPSGKWLYVSDERFNKLYMFRCLNDQLEAEPAFCVDTLADPGDLRPRQIAGPIHVHPDGHTVYIANRADQAIELDGHEVFAGGENNIAVFSIDATTGEPRLIQHAPTKSIHVRTFSIDPTGSLLIAGSIKPLMEKNNEEFHLTPAALSIFRLSPEGRLSFVHRRDLAPPPAVLHYWCGMLAAP